MVKRLGIITAGGLARAVASHFEYEYQVVYFVDKPKISGESIQGIPVVNTTLLIKHVVACGDPKRRRGFGLDMQVPWTTLIHRNANVSRYASIGEGSIVCPGVGIDPEVRVGRHVYLDYNTVIGHGVDIGDYTVIAPLVLVAGYCEIGEGVYIGAGAKIVKKAKIGKNSVIGAGAVVLKDVPPNQIWAGVPAKRIGDNPE
jgi:acetyltransferase EpsM